MKWFLLLVLTLFHLVSSSENAQAAEKTLVVYFSHSGNTRYVAERIHNAVGGDIFEIKTVNTYPQSYNDCIAAAKKEQDENARPVLSSQVSDMAAYDTVIVGYPNWWGTIPMALFTFFESYDFTGKTIVPFCTHEGSRLGRSEADIKKLCPDSTIKSGLAIRGSGVRNSNKDVVEWLEGHGITN
jgi:flavodoxin